MVDKGYKKILNKIMSSRKFKISQNKLMILAFLLLTLVLEAVYMMKIEYTNRVNAAPIVEELEIVPVD